MNDDDLERDLRRVLADPGHRLPDRLVPLERVHAGGAQRRRRHRAITASVAVLAVVGIGLGLAHPWAGSADGSSLVSGASSSAADRSSALPSQPSASPDTSTASSNPSAVSPAPATITLGDVSGASSVTAIDDRHWWVAAQLGCSGCPDQVLRTADDGASFSFASSASGTDAPNIASVRYVDRTDGTLLTTDGELLSTTDGGKTWAPAVSSAASFFAVEAGGSRTTYALQHGADSGIHLWRQVAPVGAWVDIATLPQSSTPGADYVALAVQGEKAVVVWRAATAVVSATYDTHGNTDAPKPIAGCDVSLSLGSISSGQGAVWLSCQTGTADTVLRTSDLGATWHAVTVPGDAGRHVVGAIDATHAVITTADGLARLGADGTLGKPVAIPGGASGVTYIGFTNPTHAFALASEGQLLRTSDGGLTWATVRYTG